MVDPLRVRVTGVLAPFAEGFVVAVAEAGYQPNGGAKQVQLLAHLSRWLEAEGLGPADLDGEVIGRFFAARRAAGYRERLTPRSGEGLFAYLRGLGVVPMASALSSAPQGPMEELLARFERYLLLERGLLADTAHDYVHSVRPFLEGFADADHVDVSRLDGPAVVAFVIERCPRQTRSSAKRTVKALRSMLGFLHAEGYVERSLTHAVPAAGGWRLAALPKRLEPDQVRRLLAACDRRGATGRRDFAVLTVLARLGLRAGEVAGLSLDDIDWRAGEVVVHGKGGRSERLPLPADVGEAMVAYLQHGRPASALGRTLFVRVKAPHRTLTNKAVSAIVLRAATRAGLPARFTLDGDEEPPGQHGPPVDGSGLDCGQRLIDPMLLAQECVRDPPVPRGRRCRLSRPVHCVGAPRAVAEPAVAVHLMRRAGRIGPGHGL